MKRKPKNGAVDSCLYHECLNCSDKSACASCGWNPGSDVRKRRIQAILRDREERLRTGKVRIYT